MGPAIESGLETSGGSMIFFLEGRYVEYTRSFEKLMKASFLKILEGNVLNIYENLKN